MKTSNLSQIRVGVVVLLVLISFVYLLLPDLTQAQTAPGGLVTCNGIDCSACNFVEMINLGIVILFGAVGLIFAVIMMKAGFGLVTSGGNPGALTAAKDHFQNALVGLLIVMAAWLFVDVIMRTTLRGGEGNLGATFSGWGPWSEVRCQTQTVSREWAGDPASPSAASTTPPLPGPAPATCTGGTCVPIGIPCANPNSCSISPDLADNFQAMHAAAGVSGARVTEAMPPTRTHRSACHTQGTCIDYSRAGGMSPAEVIQVIDAARANGLRPVYEVQTQAQRDALVAAGAPAASVVVLGNWISAPHFSIYGY